jgi:hypothetical protein
MKRSQVTVLFIGQTLNGLAVNYDRHDHSKGEMAKKAFAVAQDACALLESHGFAFDPEDDSEKLIAGLSKVEAMIPAFLETINKHASDFMNGTRTGMKDEPAPFDPPPSTGQA